MKHLWLLTLGLAALVGCGSSATRGNVDDARADARAADQVGEDRAGEDLADHVATDTSGDLTPTQTVEECAELAKAKALERRVAGSTDQENEALFLAEIQRCTAPSWAAERSAFAAAINRDYREAAGGFLGKTLSPGAYARLLKDRARKVSNAMNDAALLAEVADGDQDSDRVPDSRDECPETPKLSATNDAGCPEEGDPELTAVQCADLMADWKAGGSIVAEAPPYECFAYEAIENATIMYHPKCEGAATPSIPIPQNLYPNPQGVYLMSQVTNQPDGCPVMYEVQVSAFFQQISRNWTKKEAFSAKDDQDADGKVAQFQVGAGHPKPDVVHIIDQEFDRTYRWRVRSVNGSGQLSEWSDWVGRSCPNHNPCSD